MNRKIIISESWNFHLSDGNSILINKNERKYKDYTIAIVLSNYILRTRIIYIRKRDKYGNLNIFDYDIVNNKIGQFIAIGYYD